MMLKIDYIENLSCTNTKELSKEQFESLIDRADLDVLARRLESGEWSDEAKRRAPAVLWQASFREHRRTSQNAVPNGLFGLDVDHLPGDPDEAWRRLAEGRTEALGIVLGHKSIGGHGLHVVAQCRPGLRTLAENQLWLAEELQLPYDEKCKDWARCWILAPRRYFYFVDEDLWR